MVADVVERFGDDLTTRLEELFAKESDPYTSNEYMLVVMNQIRCQKFGYAFPCSNQGTAWTARDFGHRFAGILVDRNVSSAVWQGRGG